MTTPAAAPGEEEAVAAAAAPAEEEGVTTPAPERVASAAAPGEMAAAAATDAARKTTTPRCLIRCTRRQHRPRSTLPTPIIDRPRQQPLPTQRPSPRNHFWSCPHEHQAVSEGERDRQRQREGLLPASLFSCRNIRRWRWSRRRRQWQHLRRDAEGWPLGLDVGLQRDGGAVHDVALDREAAGARVENVRVEHFGTLRFR